MRARSSTWSVFGTSRFSRRPFGAALAVLMFALPAVVASTPAALAQGPSCGDSWTNPTGGTWGTGTNWSTGAPPTASQVACITIPLSGPVVLGGAGSAGTAASLTLGGMGGPDELVLEGSVLTLASASTVARTGEVTSEGTGTLVMEGSSVLANHGLISTAGYGNSTWLYGNITNEPDGWVSVSSQAAMNLATGTFTNSGELTVGPQSSLYAPYEVSTGAVIDNLNGLVQNQGAITVNGGGTFEEGSGVVLGTPPQISTAGVLDLVGKGLSSFEVSGGSLSGTIGASQTVLLYNGGGPVQTAGPLTNDGTILLDAPGGGTVLDIPSGDALTNAGAIVVGPGNSFELAGNLVNQAAGTIVIAGNNSAGGSSLTLEGGVTLTNDGTVDVGSIGSSLNAGGAGTIDNAAGTIADGGTVTVPSGATFTEGSGTTTGNPVQVTGVLDLTGAGASSFQLGGTISGNVAEGQTVELGVGLGSPVATGSFTNDGTLVGDGSLALPSGDTLTNDGTIEFGHGTNWNGLTINGNLANAANGVIGEDGGSLQMGGTGTTFDNAGTLDLLYSGNLWVDSCGSGPCNNTFINTGTIYEGTHSADAQWGSGAYASDLTDGGGDSVDLGGTIVPVPDGEPSGGSGSQISYNLVSGPGTPPAWALSCSASVASGWELSCSNGTGADLVEPQSSTLAPTEVTVAGSGTSYSDGWQSGYGQAVTLTATVSAQEGGPPTGTVAFYAAQQYSSIAYTPAAIGPDLLGTATLSTSNALTTATLRTSSLPPGEYELLAVYSGSSADLAAATTYSATDVQKVSAQSTNVSVASSPASSVFGGPVTLTATVAPGGYGPASPTGTVTFFNGGTVVGSAAVVTKGGVTTAQLATRDLPAGSASITASYSGDYNYAAGISPAFGLSVSSPAAPTTVTVSGPSTVSPGGAYDAQSTSNGTGAVMFALASTPAPPAGMTINAATGKVSYGVPSNGASSFSYAVVASNAAGQAQSPVVTVDVS